MALLASDLVARYTGPAANPATSRGGAANNDNAFNIPVTGLLNVWDKIFDAERIAGTFAGGSLFEYRSIDLWNINTDTDAIDAVLEMVALVAPGHQSVAYSFFIEQPVAPNSVASITTAETQSPEDRYGLSATWVDFNPSTVGGANLIQLRGRSASNPLDGDTAGVIEFGHYCRIWLRRKATAPGAAKASCNAGWKFSAE